MSTLLTYLRIGGELLLLVPVLPVLGMMWLAWAITCETSSEPQPNDVHPKEATPPGLPPAEPVSLPQPASDGLTRPRSRRAKKYQRRLLLRQMDHGDYVTDWQM
jgi:hypothetical protein